MLSSKCWLQSLKKKQIQVCKMSLVLPLPEKQDQYLAILFKCQHCLLLGNFSKHQKPLVLLFPSSLLWILYIPLWKLKKLSWTVCERHCQQTVPLVLWQNSMHLYCRLDNYSSSSISSSIMFSRTIKERIYITWKCRIQEYRQIRYVKLNSYSTTLHSNMPYA